MWKRKLQNFRDIFQFGDKNLEMRRMASPPALPRREGAGVRQVDSIRIETPQPPKGESSKIVVSQ